MGLATATRPLAAIRLRVTLVAGLVLSVLASVLSAVHGRPPATFLPVGVSGVVFVVSGFVMARRRPDDPIGELFMAVGWVQALAVVLVYVASWGQVVNMATGPEQVLLVGYVLLAFPLGRLTARIDRVALLALATVFACETVLVLLSYEPVVHTNPCTWCGPNPLRVTDLDVYRVVGPVVDASIGFGILVLLALVVRRFMHARGAQRRVLSPVLFGGVVLALGAIAGEWLGPLLLPGANLGPALLLLRLLVPIGLAVTFLQLYSARGSLAGAVVQLGTSPSSAELESALRSATHDPTLTVLRWSPAADAYLDREGQRVDPASLGADRSTTRLELDGRPLGAVVFDPALGHDDGLVQAIADAARFGFASLELREDLHARGGDIANLPRGQVAFLFGDLEGSTALLAALGDEYAEVLAAVRSLVRETAGRHDGRVVDVRADECFLVFGEADRAIEAALELQRALAETRWPGGQAVRMRIGLHLGTPTVTSSGYVGLDVHLAARVMAAGHGGQILVSRDLVDALGPRTGTASSGGFTTRSLGLFRLPGIAEPIELYRLEAGGSELDDRPPRAVVAAGPSQAPDPAGAG